MIVWQFWSICLKSIINNYLQTYILSGVRLYLRGDTLHLCESKHSKNAFLPSSDDIKDGLLKLMLYNNIDSLQDYKKFKPILRLTSSLLKDCIKLPSDNLESFLQNNAFTKAQSKILQDLNIESKINNFEIWINDEL